MTKDSIREGLAEIFQAVKDVGIFNTIAVLIALGIAWKLPAIIRELNGVLSTVLHYKNEKRRILDKVKDRQLAKTASVGKRKAKIPPASKLRP